MHLKLSNPEHPFHLTIIHAKGRVPEDLKRHGIQPLREGPLICRAIAVESFGPPDAPLRGVRLEMGDRLQLLRVMAEQRLVEHGIPWSQQWPFNPHSVIGDAPAPTELIFTHIGWE